VRRWMPSFRITLQCFLVSLKHWNGFTRSMSDVRTSRTLSHGKSFTLTLWEELYADFDLFLRHLNLL